jgi:hypothetical protein
MPPQPLFQVLEPVVMPNTNPALVKPDMSGIQAKVPAKNYARPAIAKHTLFSKNKPMKQKQAMTLAHRQIAQTRPYAMPSRRVKQAITK